MTAHTFTTGDLVMVNPAYARPNERGIVYRVTKVLPVNIQVTPVAGGRPMRANPDMFLPAPTGAATTDTTSSTDTTGVTYQPAPLPLYAATIVTVAGPGWRQPADQLYVVLRDNGDKVSLAKLGGDNGRYWRGVRRTMLTVIDPTHITYTQPPA
jgi:hypothetical protein